MDKFRILPLGSYDGIVGLDWLAKYSPMTTHWAQGWLSFQRNQRTVLLQGVGHQFGAQTVVEVQMVQENPSVEPPTLLPEMKQLLDQFVVVFAEPQGLPPVRQCDHHIPLMQGARPVSVRPYRVAPHLKDEIEK